jgi:hypothetical protein
MPRRCFVFSDLVVILSEAKDLPASRTHFFTYAAGLEMCYVVFGRF